MTTVPGKQPTRQYLNPVFCRSFPDPFVLKLGGLYYAYCTGIAPSGSVFEVIRSPDLVNWESVGAAMEPLSSGPPFYWAPEVIYSNGRFYLYYSSGNETLMEIRVAVSDRPDGRFVDSGHRLTHEEFAIDAHVFTDDDDQKYLFYATDFLGHSHIGTGTVVDKMLSWFELEGDPKPVTRAAFDWQVYDPHRVEKGGVRWHTVEGPTVFKHKTQYFQMFSGGNWKNSTYGVGFATSDAVLDSQEWRQSIDGETVFPILRTIPEKVIGPGHNSAIVGPNGRELFCVYHSWVGDARVMSIDRMDFVSDRLFVNGPTFESQPAPFRPSITHDFLIQESQTQGWQLEGGSAISPNVGKSSIPLGQFQSGLMLQFTAKQIAGPSGDISVKVDHAEMSTTIRISTGINKVGFYSGSIRKEVDIPEHLDLHEFQTFAVEINASRFEFSINGQPLLETYQTQSEIFNVSLETVDVSYEICDLFLTEGFVDLFDRRAPSTGGWTAIAGEAAIEIADQEMRVSNLSQTPAIITKGIVYPEFEFAANIRRLDAQTRNGSFEFVLLNEDGEIVNSFEIAGPSEGAYHIAVGDGTSFPLPTAYSRDKYRQFRFVRIGGTLRLESEEQFLGEVNVGTFPATVGILCKGAAVGLDMVRTIKTG